MTKIKLQPKVIFILCVTLIAAVLLTLGLLEQRKVRLTAALRGKWVQQVENQKHAWLELHVETGEMEYRFASNRYPDYNAVLAEYTWRAVSKNQIEVRFFNGNRAITTVTLTDDALTLDPAVTATTKTESWKRAE